MDELVKRIQKQAVYLPEKFSKNAELLDIKKLMERARQHGFNPKRKTQGDAIRSMTDEELAEWFSIYGCRNKTYDAHCETFKNCESCWLDWLKEVVEP